MKALLAALPFALLALPALAHDRLPDGTYVCTMEQYIAGTMEIAGNMYKGPAFNGQYDGAYEFDVDEYDNIHWTGPVGGYTGPGFTLIASRIISRDNDDNVGIEMSVKQDPSENIHFVQCFRNR